MNDKKTKTQTLSAHPPDNMLIILRKDSRSDEGIVVPDSDNPERIVQGTIIRRGPGMPTVTGERLDMLVGGDDGKPSRVTAGDVVVYRQGNTTQLKIGDSTFDIMSFSDVIVVFKVE